MNILKEKFQLFSIIEILKEKQNYNQPLTPKRSQYPVDKSITSL